jgi:hypothetical protein
MIMQTKFLKYTTRVLLISALCLAAFGTIFTSCDDDDDDGMTTGVVLESFGPMPIARGAQLSFIGRNLDQVTAIVLPSSLEITEFGTKTSGLITLTVPQNAVEGFVVLKTPQGEIKTKTEIGYMEPIAIESFTPTSIKAGQELTIKGDYLNMVKEVIFTDRTALGDTAFITQNRTELKLLVPAGAQTGKIAVSNGAEDPVIVYSEADLTVTLPAFAEISPNPVKAGEMLTITGTNLDLVEGIVLGGEKTVVEFESQSETKIELNVPADTQDGKVTMVPASMVAVVSEVDLILIVPTVGVAPTTVKNGGEVTITGTNLDLITKVEFASGTEGTISDGGTDTEIMVTVPELAISGEIVFSTASGKTVSGGEITIVAPTITGFEPASGKPNTDLVITGADLDLVAKVVFTGGLEGTISAQSETSLTASIPVGAQTGAISLIAINGVEVKTASDFEVLSNLPDFTSFSEPRGEPGKILTLNGTKLDLIKELIFPGGVTATAYGMKTDTKVEVYVPTSVQLGFGQITMITYEGEEGLLPEVYFGGTDPVLNQELCFFDFNGTGKDSWWGNAISSGPLDDPDNSADGTPFWNIDGISGTGWWDGLFFRNGGNNFVTTGVDANTWAVRFDMNVRETIHEGILKVRLGNFYYDFAPWEDQPNGYKTTGWITVTLPLSGFKDGDSVLTDPAVGGSEFGMIWSAGTAVKVNMGIDNVRFEPIP